ncbi:MAG: FAD-dependent oxidoreductase [Spirochaetaceae bacterium]|nr:MAG: FAD-dependent oxidoreductase [Spirochaetaceae bacterium]
MAKPVILTVDDEPQVLSAIERDLRQRFSSEYRVLKSGSGKEALQTVRELKKRNTPVALLLVDQRMPEMSGTDFLSEAVKLYPEAKKALLTAYSDTQAAIKSINQLGLDYYLMKPWDPPEQELYPVLEDLLGDWIVHTHPPYEGIRVLGTLWSPDSHTMKDFLSRNQIPYQWLDVEKDEEGKRLWEALNGSQTLPVAVFPDGDVLVNPTMVELAEKCGLQTKPSRPFYDLIIIGGGPAGLAAAVYGGSEGLHTVLVERQATGGQAGTSSMIENYLGFPRGVSGADLARRATTQARRFGVEILSSEVVGVNAEETYRFVRLSNGSELSCHALLISTGVSLRTLDIPGIERLAGAGVYYGAALTEAVNYKGEDVLVVGGANSAGQGAMFFSRYARTVYLCIRGDSIEAGMSQYLVDQIRATKNIELMLGTQVEEVSGEVHLESARLRNGTGGRLKELSVTAMFIFIGATARTDMLDGLVERDEEGFILTGRDIYRDGRRPRSWTLDRDPLPMETSVPGIFAAGDVRHQSIKRVASAVGEGAVAVSLVHQYLRSV